MLCTSCPRKILSDFYRIPEKSPKSSADKMNRACESKDQTLKKMRTSHFPESCVNLAKQATLTSHSKTSMRHA